MGGKSSGQSKDYYGHCAGIVCQGQLDFIWGVLENNDLVWPVAKSWDAQVWQSGQTVTYSGSAYQASSKTNVDPPSAPWTLFAAAWMAGTYHEGDRRLYLGNVWICKSTTSSAPPATAPARVMRSQEYPITNGWQYVSTPSAWASTNYWPANSIVAWKGRLYITNAGTKVEPPASPWSLWKQDFTTNPMKITVPSSGDIFIYRGASDQTLDTVDEKILDQLGHPPYRNKAVLMLKNYLFGTQQQTPPDIILLGGRNPVQSIITGASASLDSDWQANPWCVLAELLTHPAIGLGLPDSFFDLTTWQTEADRCAANPSLYYISPLYTSAKKVREVVADLMSYPDAFIFWSNLATLIAGHWPHGDAPPSMQTINRDDVTEEFKSDSDLWAATAGSVEVAFDDIQSGFRSRPAFAQNLFNATALKRMQSQKVDRPHIVRFNQAVAWASEMARIAGDMAIKGELTVRAERVGGINPGTTFLLTDDVLATSQAQRCTRRTVVAPPAGLVKLSHETERGIAPQPYSPTMDNATAALAIPPGRLGNFAVVQLPSSLGESSSIAVLAGRTNDVTTMFDAWFRQADGAAFQDLGTMHAFAVPGVFGCSANATVNDLVSGQSNKILFSIAGTVVQGSTYNIGSFGFWKNQVRFSANADFSSASVAVEGVDYILDSGSGDLTIVSGGGIATGKYVQVFTWQKLLLAYDLLTPQSDLDSILESLTQDEVDGGSLLLFAFQAANPALFEIMRVAEVSAASTYFTGSPALFATVYRAQLGTLFGGDGSHEWGSNTNDVFFVIKRSGIVPLTHDSFAGFQSSAATMSLRLAPASAWIRADIADIYDAATNPAGLATAFDYTFSNIYAPTVTWGQLLKNGTAISDFTINFTNADAFSFSFELNDVNGDLIHGALVAVQGQQEVTLWSSNFTKASVVDKTVNFTLANGTWTIEMRMLDAAGNQSSIPLTVASVLVVMKVGTGTGGTAAAPITHTGYRGGGYWNGVTFGYLPAVSSGFAVKYQIQNRNVAYNPASWITCHENSTGASGSIYGDTTYGTLPPIKMGSTGQTLYAYCTQTAKSDSAVVKWNF